MRKTVIFAFAFVVFSGMSVSADSCSEALDLAQRTLDYVERRVKRPAFAARLALYVQREAAITEPALRVELERQIRRLRRAIIFSHPDLDFDRILAVQRGVPYAWDAEAFDPYVGRWSRPGPGLVFIENWKTEPHVREVLKGKLPTGTVLNPDLHWDADRVIFAFCDHEAPPPPGLQGVTIPRCAPYMQRHNWEKLWALDPGNPNFTAPDGSLRMDDSGQAHRRYFIYEAALDGSWVRQLTGGPGDPMETVDGRQTIVIEDADPCYLPDGGFAFISSRCQGLGRCHWGVYIPAFHLYRADADGSHIRRLSYGEANEWEPSVLNDGRIAYTRWDYISRNAVWYQGLWTMRPDGTGTAHFYGNYTKNPCVATEVKAIPGTQVVVATASAHHYITAGSIFTIDPRKGEDGPEPVTRITPESPFTESEGMEVPTPSCCPMPVNETLFFVSRSEEPIAYPAGDPRNNTAEGCAWPSPGAYGIWLVDTLGGRELIYRNPDIGTFNPIPVVRRPKPPVLPSTLPKDAPPHGICYLTDVYTSRVEIPRGSIKALRLNRVVTQPTVRRPTPEPGSDLEPYFETLGAVPVAEDGSAAFQMPAGIPVQLQALDADGKAIMTMRSFIYVQPGEVLGCVGCHESRKQAPVDVNRARTVSVPVRELDLGYAGVLNFHRTVQPVFDRACVGCHGLGKAKMSLVGADGHRNLIASDKVCVIKAYEESETSAPYDYYAAASPLFHLLKKGHHDVALTEAEWKALILWMDLNPPRYGINGYDFNQPENREVDPAGERALRAAVAARWGEAVAAQPFDALVNRGDTAKSRLLLGALPRAAGGWELLPKPFTGRDDPAFARFAKLVEGTLRPLPWKTIAGTCGRGHAQCVCRSCWVRESGINQPVSNEKH